MTTPESWREHPVAVLASGGPDSAVLVGELARSSPRVVTAINLALGGQLRLVRPYALLTKTEILQRGRSFPLGETWSCLFPIAGRQCRECNKCAERRRAFAKAGLNDPTVYARPLE